MQDRSSIDVAVVGIGCRFPKAGDVHEYWTNILEGRPCFSDVPRDRWDHRAFYSASQREVDKTWTARGGFIDDVRSFAALHYGVPPRRLEVMDPQHRLLIECVREAMQDGGYDDRPFDRERTGVFTGVSVAEYKNLMSARITAMQLASGQFGPAAATQELRDAIMEMTRNAAPIRAFSIAGSLTNMAAASVAQTFDFGGPAYSIDAACAAGAVSIGDAILHLRAGLLDVAFAGGAYLNLTPDNLIGFTRVGAISPTGVCRPFDHRADGFVQGDGVGVLMLKRLGDAVKDGDRIYGVIRGIGCNNDGRGEGPMTPRVEGQLAVLKAAYRDAAVSPATVAYFEAHGTATRVGDPVELESLGRTLLAAGVTAETAPLIGSVKANVGHTMSTAGVAGIIKALKMVEQRVSPPMTGFEAPHPALNLETWPVRIETEARPLEGKNGEPLRVGVSAFGFGGTNAHFVIEEAPEPVRRRRALAGTVIDHPQSVIVTAPDRKLLVAHLRDLAEAIEGPRAAHATLGEIAWTLNATRRREKLRVVISARSRAELAAELRTSAEALAAVSAPVFPLKLTPRCTVHQAPEGAVEAPKLAFLFPGQGAQRVGLLRDLQQRFPALAARFEALASACDGVLPRSLASYLYPEVTSATQLAEAEAALTATEVCQPAMAALGLSLASFLEEEAGVRAHVSLGHSLGEFAAIAHGGITSASDAVRLVALRGQAMAALDIPDRGAMAAISASAEEVAGLIAGTAGVWLCNFNHPRQVSISGTTEGVRIASEKLAAAGLQVQPLSVSHAFHSPLLEPMREAMVALSKDLALSPPRHAVASCIADRPHGDDAAHTHRVILDHSTAPVDFVRGLHQARAAGATLFVQLGAGGMLTSFARATLGIETLNLTPLEGDGGLEFTRALCTLSVLGVPVRFEALIPQALRGVIDLPATPLEREPYWLIKSETQLLARLDHPLPEAAEGFGVVDVERTEMKPVDQAPAPAPAAPSHDLLALFAQQAEILRQHAEIIAAQNRLLLGGEPEARPTLAAPSVAAAPVVTALAPSERPTIVPPPPTLEQKIGALLREPAPIATQLANDPPSSQVVEDRVFEIVAKVSAFPRASLRADQKLVEELGFDSLMVADLGKALDGAFPQLGGLPQNLFSARTTLGDVAGHVSKSVTRGPAPRAEEAIAPLSVYRVAAVESARAIAGEVEIRGETWLVTEEGDAVSRSVVAALESRGAEVLRVQLTSDAIAEPERFEPGALHVWPDACADHLAAAIERGGRQLGGWIHTSGLAATSGLSGTSPARDLHALARKLHAPRIGVITGLGGKLGLEASPALERGVLQAGLHGYAKALGRERPDSIVRVIDLDLSEASPELGEEIMRELLGADLTPETGLRAGKRFVTELTPWQTPVTAALGREDVVLVTGGAGDLGSKIARALSGQKLRGLVLLGRRAATVEIDRLTSELSALGTPTAYAAADVSDALALDAALKPIEARLGPVTAAIHAAGLIEDGSAEKKTLESFDRVMGAKLDGLRSLITARPKLAWICLFSSWSARFGNAGQTDYAAANETLDRLAIAGLGSTRVLSIDWPPWSESAMVRGIPSTIQNAMRAAGVTFVGDEEGTARTLALIGSGTTGLVVIGRELPRAQPRLSRSLEISLERQPYLNDHRLKGEPVLPLASATDLLLDVAGRGLPLAGPLVLEDLELVRGVIARQPQRVEARLEGKASSDGGSGKVELLLADVPVSGAAHAPGKKWSVAYRATVKSGVTPKDLPAFELGGTEEALPFDLATFYQRYTFHGPQMQGILRIDRMTSNGIRGLVKPSSISAMAPGDERSSWAADPLVLDSSFQLAGYWAYVHHQKAGYPIGFARLVQLRPFGDRPVVCTVVFASGGEDRFSGHIRYEDEAGRLYAILEGIEGRFAALEPVEVEAQPHAHGTNGHGANGNGTNGTHAPEVPSERWDIAQFPEVEALDQRLQMAELIGLKNPYFAVHEGTARNRSVVEGVEMINFSSYNYLGFSGHPEVVAAAQDAISRYGTSVSASRIASGERPIHRQLELGIAEHVGVEDAIVMVSGHATNVTTVSTLLGPDDIIFHDSLIHDSLLAGIRLSGAARRPFPHGNLDALERALKQIRGTYRRALICAEGIYSMDGDTCDLPRLIELKKRYKALLLIDEAHSIGVLGPRGNGIAHHFAGLNPNDVDVWMGTLSKSFASCGGYIAGSKALVRFLKYSAGGFVYSAGITPPNCAAGIKSLELMRAHPEIVAKLISNSKLFLEVARARGLDTGMAIGAAVIPVIVGNSMDALKLSAALARRKINVNPIVYPAVEDDAARLRFFLSSTHTEEELRFTAGAVAEELQKIRSGEDSAMPELSAK